MGSCVREPWIGNLDDVYADAPRHMVVQQDIYERKNGKTYWPTPDLGKAETRNLTPALRHLSLYDTVPPAGPPPGLSGRDRTARSLCVQGGQSAASQR